MPSTLETNQKISSLGNMQKVTRAMNMIASIRLRKLIARLEALSAFEKSLGDLLPLVVPVLSWESHPLVTGYADLGTVHFVTFTADRGLCGSHNNSVNKALDKLAAKVREQGASVEVTCIGTKGNNYARRKGYKVFHQTESGSQVLNTAAVEELADKLFHRFVDGQVQAVYFISNHFLSKIRQETQGRLVLPFAMPDLPLQERPPTPTIDLAPQELALQGGRLLFRYFLALAVAHSALSEQASRMTAMENASKNAQDLTAFYTKVRNRVRQSNITSELTEIISGKEAMKR